MFKLALDAGHYMGTPGKRCLISIDPNETREWVLNDRVADKIEEYLADYNEIEILRLDDTTGQKEVELSTRVNKANQWDADFYLSIHHNAGIQGGSGGGIVAYVYPQASEKSRDWQKKLYNKLIEYEPNLIGNRYDPLADGNLFVCRETSMPAVLLELGFMDSTNDTPIILRFEHAVRAARAIVDVLVDEWNLKRKENTPVAPVIEPAEFVEDEPVKTEEEQIVSNIPEDGGDINNVTRVRLLQLQDDINKLADEFNDIVDNM